MTEPSRRSARRIAGARPPTIGPERAGQHDVAGPQRPALATIVAPASSRMQRMPRQAAPAPTRRSRRSSSAPSRKRRSTSPDCDGSPSTKRAEEALSATVSTMLMFQFCDAAVDDLDRRQHEIDRAQQLRSSSDPSRQVAAEHEGDLGLRTWLEQPRGDTSPPFDTAMSANRTPKSGWSTPSWRCTACDVSPILRPTMRRPAALQWRVLISWIS